jgi:hypothetical protein
VAAIERGLDLIEQYARSTGLFRREEMLFVRRTIQFDNAGDNRKVARGQCESLYSRF